MIERAPGATAMSSAQLKAAASDIPIQADGSRGSVGGNAANTENSLFNKHYNKELKLCEGKCFPYFFNSELIL